MEGYMIDAPTKVDEDVSCVKRAFQDENMGLLGQ